MIGSWLEKTKDNNLLSSFSVLAKGSIIAQALTILISPLITRLYTTEQFGFYTLLITAVSLFGPVICLKYDMAIVSAKTNKETYSLINLSVVITLILSCIVSLFYSCFLLTNANSNSFLFSFFVILALLMTYGINNILLAINNRKSSYKLISKVTVIRSGANSILLILLGIFKTGVLGLVSSQIISSLMSIGKLSKVIRTNFKKIKSIKLSTLIKVARIHKKLPFFNAPSALITTTVYSSVNLFIGYFYTVHQLGLYSMSYRILGLPFAIISANLAKVYFNNAIKELKINNNYNKAFKQTIVLLLITIIPLVVLIGIISPYIFSFVFGDKWEKAGLYIRFLAPMFAVKLIAESLTTGFIVSEKQHVELSYQSTLFSLQIVLYFLTIFFNLGIESFLIGLSLLYILVYTTMIFYMNKLSKGSITNAKN